MKQMVMFGPNELVQHIDIVIIDDNVWEPDEVFFVKLSLDPDNEHCQGVMLGKLAIQEITILNDDGMNKKYINLTKPMCLIDFTCSSKKLT